MATNKDIRRKGRHGLYELDMGVIQDLMKTRRQVDVAEGAGLVQSRISAIFKRGAARSATIKKIAQGLGVDPIDLIR